MTTTVLGYPTTLGLAEQQTSSQENPGGQSDRFTPLGSPNSVEQVPPLYRAFDEFAKVCNLMNWKQQNHIFIQLHEVQKTLAQEEGPPRIQKISRSATCSYAFAVTAEKIYVLGNIIAQGASTTVYYSSEIDTVRGTPAEFKALKERQGDFETERAVLNQLTLYSKSGPGRAHNELFEECFEGIEGGYYAINSPSEGTLEEEDYRLKDYPIIETVQQFIDYLSGLGTLHESGLVHRNISKDTLLSNANKLSGYQDVEKEHTGQKRYHTRVIPFYAAPFIWTSILGQKDGTYGKQTRESDLFAMGRVIQYDVIRNILIQLGDERMNPIAERICAQVCTTPYLSTDRRSDHILLEAEKEYPNRVIYAGINPGGNDVYYLFPTNNEVYQVTLEGIELLRGVLSDQELGRLGDLADFACGLQNSDPQKIPTYAQAQGELLSLLEPIQGHLQEDEQAILEGLMQDELPEEQQAQGEINEEGPGAESIVFSQTPISPTPIPNTQEGDLSFEGELSSNEASQSPDVILETQWNNLSPREEQQTGQDPIGSEPQDHTRSRKRPSSPSTVPRRSARKKAKVNYTE